MNVSMCLRALVFAGLVSVALAAGGEIGSWRSGGRSTTLLPDCDFTSPVNTGGAPVAVDSQIGEWDISENSPDFFANLYKNGDTSGPILAKAYARYTCSDGLDALGTLYVMVNVVDGQRLDHTLESHLVKIDGHVRMDGEGEDMDPVQFEFHYDPTNVWRITGYEAMIPATPGGYALQVETLLDSFDDNGIRATSGEKYDRCVTIECDSLAGITETLEGTVWEDCDPSDGILGAGEAGIEMATVTLFFCDGTMTGRSTMTDADGRWVLGTLDTLTQPAGSEGFYAMVNLPDSESTFSPIPPPQVGVITTDANFNGRMPATGCVDPGADTLDAGACNPSVAGDPHFTGFLNQRFVFSGEDAHVYNLVSTPHVQYNARFVKTQYKVDGVYQTLIREMGIRIGGTESRVRVFLDPDQLADDQSMSVEVNGELVSWRDSRLIKLSDDGTEWVRRVPRKRREVIIQTRDMYFHVKGQMKMHPHLDDGVKMLNWAGETHGLLGQTKDPQHAQKQGEDELNADKEWPYFLDGSAADYDAGVEDVFSVDTKFNLFEDA